jgi:ABC-type multidrug transport system permease subunit
MTNYHPFRELLKTRLREFIREPETIFWVYAFPVLLTIGLGIAFRNRPAERIFVDIQQQPGAEEVAKSLGKLPDLVVAIHSKAECMDRLRLAKSALVVISGNKVEYLFDPTRPESVLARQHIDDALQRAAGRRDPLSTSDHHITEPGARYIDYLIPGLIGMNLLAGSMWGVGYVIVDMRVRKLLKRFMATPMKRSHFLWAALGGRMVFMVPELIVILGAGVLLFEFPIRGNVFSIFFVSLLGATSFTGLGLLAACRAQKLETVSGIMNVIMMPMWVLSGIFFSPERFPDIFQPFIQALPLTQFNNALRAIILEGASLDSQLWRIVLIAAWGAISYLCTLRWFRWN